MVDRPVNAAPANVADLPALLTRSQAAGVVGCGVSTLDRWLRDPAVDLWPLKLGPGAKAPVRIGRDQLLTFAGLLPSEDAVRRDRRRASAEYDVLAAKLGIAVEDDRRSDVGVRA